MWDEFTKSTRLAIHEARRAAMNDGVTSVTIDHLLRGLIGDPNSEVSHQLARLGLAPADLLAIAPSKATGLQKPSEREMQLSPEAKAAIERAYDVSHRLGHSSIDADHLLAALLECAEMQGDFRFRDVGLTSALVVGDIANDGGVWPPPPQYAPTAPVAPRRRQSNENDATAAMGMAVITAVISLSYLTPWRSQVPWGSLAWLLLATNVCALIWARKAYRSRPNPTPLVAGGIAAVHLTFIGLLFIRIL